jgi:hypothetical protein
MNEPEPPEDLDPRTRQELEQHREFYQDRVDWRDSHVEGGMGTVGLPSDPSEQAVRLFHIVMTEHGPEGVEYAQEGLHQNGEYFDQFFVEKNDSFDEARADLELDLDRFKEVLDE